jgi:transcriptional regulator with XRE-family HTH domain
MTNKLRVRRAELDVTQHDVAQRIGIHRDRFWRIENGYTDPTSDEIAALARVLDTTPAELFPGLGDQQAVA